MLGHFFSRRAQFIVSWVDTKYCVERGSVDDHDDKEIFRTPGGRCSSQETTAAGQLSYARIGAVADG